jgi:hypothetical protein
MTIARATITASPRTTFAARIRTERPGLAVAAMSSVSLNECWAPQVKGLLAAERECQP